MYYKVIKDNRVIDVLDQLVYLKWEPKHKIMVLCDENNAQAFLSSGKNDCYHERTWYNIPSDADVRYETVDLIEIDQYEYKNLKVLNMKSPEAIIDEYNLLLLEMGVI